MYLFMLGAIFLPLTLAILMYVMNNRTFNGIIFFFQGIQSYLVFNMYKAVFDHDMISYIIGEWPAGIGIELRLDKLSLLFIILNTMAFWAIYLYSWEEKSRDHKYLFFMTFLQGSLVALFLVYDLFSMYILIELVTILAAILITYKKDGTAVKAGLFYLLYNSFGMSLFLIGIIIMYIASGSLNIAVVSQVTQGLSDQIHIRFAIACFLVSFSLKSALVPVYSWLPLAHGSAPSSVSALLSGLMVKIGLFGLIRLQNTFSVPFLYQSLMVVGICTAILGSAFAIFQSDIKRLLAYSTISQVGLMVVSISTGFENGLYGGLLHLVNHFSFKVLLFLCAGILISNTGERHIKKIRGVMSASPFVGVGLVIGVLGITGAPFFNGSISKHIIKESVDGHLMTMLLYLVNFGTLVSFIKLSQVLKGKSHYRYQMNPVKLMSIGLMSLLVLAMFPVGLSTTIQVAHINFFSSFNLLKESFIYLLMAFLAWLFYDRVVDRYDRWITDKGILTIGFQLSNGLLIVYFLIVVLFTRYHI